METVQQLDMEVEALRAMIIVLIVVVTIPLTMSLFVFRQWYHEWNAQRLQEREAIKVFKELYRQDTAQ